MKAVVLAGGHATRLWPITRDRAKPLLPVNGRPMVDYIVAELEGREGVDEILISTNQKFADDFEDYLDERDIESAEVLVEDQDCEEDKPGTIGAILNIIEEKGRDDYLIIGGDNLYSFSISEFLDFAGDKPAVACYDIGSRSEASSFGVIDKDENGLISGFEEKPEEPSSSLVSTACYFFPADSLDIFSNYEKFFRSSDVPREKYLDEPGRLLEWAHKRKDIKAFPFNGHWFDVGSREGYLKAHSKLSNNGRKIEGKVRDSDLKGNVWVMEGAEVNNSVLKDCIVFPEARIEDTTVERSIVDSEATLSGTEVSRSLVG
ncbi:MAG: sugar phosphate nucleotidyltransferase, partial [Candidatus Nanohaloarchaea archaeon]|nr:sugar phosphate nucleotidyltransferase [Candidatus Nanohaloarchaea archaeon]